MKLDFFIQCIPPKSTHQASLRILKRRDGTQFVGKFATSKGKKTEAELMTLLMPHRPVTPLQGAIELKVDWFYPYRKSEPKKNRTRSIYCNVRPDCDNLIKMLADTMTRLGFWNDDGQIAKIDFTKFWAEQAGIFIFIQELK